jgi:hypothetical protein
LAAGIIGFRLDIKRKRATTIVIIIGGATAATLQKLLALGKIFLYDCQITNVIDYKA